MNPVPRRLVSQCVIGSSCLVGLALGVLEPLHAAQRDAMSRLDEARSLSARAGELAALMPTLLEEKSALEREAEAIAARSAPARDTARLNAAIETLAARAGLTVERTQPREGPAFPKPQTHGAAAAGAAKAGGPDPADAQPIRPDAVVGFSLDVVGPYAALAAFLRALESELGYTRVVSLRISAESEHEDRLRANITTAHFAFSPPRPAPSAAPSVVEAKP